MIIIIIIIILDHKCRHYLIVFPLFSLKVRLTSSNAVHDGQAHHYNQLERYYKP